MSNYVSDQLRRLVTGRAEHLCEYCLIHEDDTFFGAEVDHIVSLKHSGPAEPANLAYSVLLLQPPQGQRYRIHIDGDRRTGKILQSNDRPIRGQTISA